MRIAPDREAWSDLSLKHLGYGLHDLRVPAETCIEGHELLATSTKAITITYQGIEAFCTSDEKFRTRVLAEADVPLLAISLSQSL